MIKRMVIEPVIDRVIIFLFGQLFLIPCTKLIIEIIKQGTKTSKNIATTKKKIISAIPAKTNIPINAILYSPFAINDNTFIYQKLGNKQKDVTKRKNAG